jgi:hypothetical protein
MGRLPTVFLEVRVVDPDLPLPRVAPPRETPVAECCSIGVYRGTVLQVCRVDPPVVLAGELLDLRCLILRSLIRATTLSRSSSFTSIGTPPSAVPFYPESTL